MALDTIEQVARHSRLQALLDGAADVHVATQTETPSGRVETELTIRSTDRNTVPRAVSQAISDSRLEIVWCVDANNPEWHRILVR